MAAYAWIIVRDLFHEESERMGSTFGYPSAQGVTGPQGITEQQLRDLEDPSVEKSTFRLRDDDREVYAEGLMLGIENPGVTGFEPLDDYGEPNWGCTEIQYRNNRRWETL